MIVQPYNPQFSLASRCLTISRIEKIIPLRIAALCFMNNEMEMNGISFKFDDPFSLRRETEEAVQRNMKSLESGDILLNYERKYINLTDVTYFKWSEDYKNKRIFSVRSLPEKVTVDEAMRKLTCYLLGQREKIGSGATRLFGVSRKFGSKLRTVTVGTVNILNTQQNILRLPPNLKLRTRKLGVGKSDISHLSKILDIPFCLPGNFIGTTAWREAYFEDSFIQSFTEIRLMAQKYFSDSSAYWLPVLMRLQNKFSLASRCFAISRIDKIIPLRIASSLFTDNEMRINGISFKFDGSFSNVRETEEEAVQRSMKSSESGDIPLVYERKYIELTDVTFFKCSKDYTTKEVFSVKRLPEKIAVNEAMRKLACYLLGQRDKVTVGVVNILNTSQNVLRLPQNLKFRTRRLAVARNDIILLSKILDIPSCLPMGAIATSKWRDAYYEDPLIQSSAELRLYARYSAYWLPVLMRIQNKTVIMLNLFFSGEEIRSIIRNMIDNRREVWTSVTLDCPGERFLNRLVRKVKERFGGTFGTFKETPKSVVVVSDIVSIPLDSGTEFIVYGFKNTCIDKKISILLAVVRIGMVVPVEEKKEKNRSFRFPWFS
ncbi:hypothetical protein CRE_09523 [Caenorhabditis remanei]|uniref:Uncharacterized protein n=1 Tax=Caenorhabditis remanei TaxID=31234 RepID=E3MJ79_CAERE|nr:hypothetical protein CRE_09523 [Caenorhabditis remanei]